MSDRKNVLLIIADQFRWDCIGAAGNSIIQTPNLDALASDGVLFTKAFCQTAPCGPSRMCIYTGSYLCSTRSVNNFTPLVDAQENLARWVGESRHHTSILGYNDYTVDPRTLHVTDRRTTSLRYDNFLPGWKDTYLHEYYSEEYFQSLERKGYPKEHCCPDICKSYDVPEAGPGEHLPLRYPAFYKAEDSEGRFLAEKTCEQIGEARDSGWLINVNFIKPHPPRICPAPYHDMYDPAGMPPANRRESELKAGHPYLHMALSNPALVEDRDLRETRACYYGMVSEVDSYVGLLVQALKDSGHWDDTLVIFTSDHGEYLGDHYLLDKAHFYDETMRVPYIIRDPSPEADVTRGRVFDQFIESIDTAPTILDYLGVPIQERVQGKSVLNQIRGCDNFPFKREIHFEYDFRGLSLHLEDENPDECVLWVLRDDRYKYVQFGLESLPPLLFDLRNDPGEHLNLADDPGHASTVAEYCQRMLRWRMKHEDNRMEHWAWELRQGR